MTFQGIESSIHVSNIRLIVLLPGPIPIDFLVIGYFEGLVSKVKSCVLNFFCKQNCKKKQDFLTFYTLFLHLMPQIQHIFILVVINVIIFGCRPLDRLEILSFERTKHIYNTYQSKNTENIENDSFIYRSMDY